jgi:hypothetical protein
MPGYVPIGKLELPQTLLKKSGVWRLAFNLGRNDSLVTDETRTGQARFGFPNVRADACRLLRAMSVSGIISEDLHGKAFSV